MKQFICDKCKKPIEEVTIDSQVYKLDSTIIVHYQMAVTDEFHYHKECYNQIKEILR